MGAAGRQRELMPELVEHYHGDLRQPPVEWQFMPMFRVVTITVVALLGPVASGSERGLHAIDHENLYEGCPLRLEDAYSIPAGEIEVAETSPPEVVQTLVRSSPARFLDFLAPRVSRDAAV